MAIRSAGPGKWVVCVVRKDPKTGKRKEVKRKCTGPKQKAKELEREIELELAEAHAERMTLGDFAKSWLVQRVANLKPSTVAKYGVDLGHICAVLGSVFVDRLRPSDIRGYVVDRSRTAAGWTVTNQLRLLRQLAKDALAEGLTDCDFCARVSPPTSRKWTESDPNLFTAEELGKFLKAVEQGDPFWYPVVATMAYTGLRWGEASGLQWDDLNEGSGVIHVRRTNWKGKPLTPKTESSNRTVPYGEELQTLLKAHRRALVASQHPGLTSGWVFSNGRGQLHTGGPLSDVMRRGLKAAGITGKKVTAHGLRRTFNDLARRVASREVVQSITGHASEAMFQHYSMVDSVEKQGVQAGVLKLVRGPVEAPVEAVSLKNEK